MNFVLIYKDKSTKRNYYYNLDNNLVYISRNTNKLSVIGIFGIIIGYIIYLGIAISSYYISNSLLFILITGFIYGSIISLIANSTIKDIFKEKGKKVSFDKLRDMYNKNKMFRIKYFSLLVFFFILTILNIILYQNITTINFLLLTTTIMTSFLFLLYRPVNNLKLYKILNRTNI